MAWFPVKVGKLQQSQQARQIVLSDKAFAFISS